MPLTWLLMLESMLACESWMVIHVAVSAIQSRILGSPSIKIKSLLDPLHIDLLILLAEVVVLWNGAFFISLTCLDRGSLDLCRDRQCLSMETPASSGLGRSAGFAGTDWFLLEAPLVVDHL